MFQEKSSIQWMNGVFCTCKAILSRGQPGHMRWILLWILPLVQNRSLELLASVTTIPRNLYGHTIVYGIMLCVPLCTVIIDNTNNEDWGRSIKRMNTRRGVRCHVKDTCYYVYIMCCWQLEIGMSWHIVSWEAKGFNYQSYQYTVSSIRL